MMKFLKAVLALVLASWLLLVNVQPVLGKMSAPHENKGTVYYATPIEQTENRTENSKLFKIGQKGNGFIIYQVTSSLEPMHYKDNNGHWQDIDVGYTDNDTGGFSKKYTKLPYTMRLATDSSRRIYPDRNDESYWIELGKSKSSMGNGIKNGNKWSWDSDDSIVEITTGTLQVKFDYILKNAGAAKHLSIPFISQGMDRVGNQFYHNGELVGGILEPFAIDAEGTIRECTMVWSNNSIDIELDTEGLVYPIDIDPTWKVGALHDNVWRDKSPGGGLNPFDNTPITLGAGCLDTASFNSSGSAMRFQSISIPAASNILTANITFTSNSNYALNTVNSSISMELALNPVAFDNITEFDARVWTAANITWDGIGAWVVDTEYESIDFEPAMQEVVDQVGWTAGNAVVVLWEDWGHRSTQVNNTFRGAYCWDVDPTKAPELNITFVGSLSDAYWVGDGGNWSDDDNHWAPVSGGIPQDGNIPASTTNVHFDANSFTLAGQSVVVNVVSYSANNDWTGVTNNPTLNRSNHTHIYGSVIYVAGMSIVGSGTHYLHGSGGADIFTSGGNTIYSLDVQPTGSYTLQDSLTMTSSITQTTGTFDTNGQTISTSSIRFAGAGAKTITMGASDITTTGTSGWRYDGSNLSITANTASITIEGTGALTGGSADWNGASFSLTGTAHDVTGSFTCGDFNRIGTAAKTDTLDLEAGSTITVTGNCALTGNSAINRVLVQSDTLGTAATINCTGSVLMDAADLMDITVAEKDLVYDGNDYLKNATANYASTNTSGAIEVWFKTSYSAGNQELVGSNDEATKLSHLRFRIEQATGQLVVLQRNAGDAASKVLGTTNVCDGDWHHGVLSSDGASWTIILDGVSEGLTVSLGANNGDWYGDTTLRDSLVIGLLNWGGGLENYMHGTIGATRIYDRQMLVPEALTNHNRGRMAPASNTTGLIFDLPSAEATGNPVDRVGALTMTVTGATWTDDTLYVGDVTNYTGDCGGNTGIEFTTATLQTWDGATASWDEVAHWTSRVPLPQDPVSAGGAGNTITIDMPRIGGNVTFTGTVTISLGNIISNYGSFTVPSTATYTHGGNRNDFRGRGSYSLSIEKSISSMRLYAPSGTYTLQANLDSSGTATDSYIQNGTIDFNGYNTWFYRLQSDQTNVRGVYLGSGNCTLSGTSSQWNFNVITNLTFDAETSTIIIGRNDVTGVTFEGGGLTYYDTIVNGTGSFTATITGSNAFNDFTIDRSSAAKTVKFTDGTTQTVADFTCATSGATVATIQGTGAAGWDIVKSGGDYVSVDYMDITSSNATPASPSSPPVWFAGTHSTDSGGNTGWIFDDPYFLTLSVYDESGVLLDTESTHCYGVSLPDIDTDWSYFNNNFFSWADNVSMLVGGIQQAYYQPNDIIETTVLPDRSGDATDNPGTIIWGTNPALITVGALGSMIPSDTDVYTPTIDFPTEDILPESGIELTPTSTSPTNPLDPMIEVFTFLWTLPAITIWQGAAVIFVLGSFLFVAIKFKHVGWAGIAACMILGIFVMLNVFPKGLLYVCEVGIISSIIVEARS